MKPTQFIPAALLQPDKSGASSTVHTPILVAPIVSALVEPLRHLSPDALPHYLVDCTFGGGGNTSALLDALDFDPLCMRHKVIAFDQDLSAIERGRSRFAIALESGRLELIHSPFSLADRYLKDRPVLGLMADLGFSSDQLEAPDRGLSFMREGPLDMRLDPSRA